MKRNKNYLWYYLVLVVMAAGAIIWPIVANLNMQLTPEQLAEARQRWQAHGPARYDLALVERIDEDTVGDEYLIRVQAGQVVEVVHADQPVSGSALKRRLAGYTVPGLFDQIERYLNEEEAGEKRNYLTAYFDKETGYPVRFVWRNPKTKQRLEWLTSLRPAR